jgi:hypothetical protein
MIPVVELTWIVAGAAVQYRVRLAVELEIEPAAGGQRVMEAVFDEPAGGRSRGRCGPSARP